MELNGWRHTGRNINSELHNQIRTMVKCLLDPTFVNHNTWGEEIQNKLGEKLNTSGGTIRTIKKMCENYGLFSKGVLKNNNEIDATTLLTERGTTIIKITSLESQILANSDLSTEEKERAKKDIKDLFEEVYCDALKEYYITNEDGKILYPLRATLQALNRYGGMDKWEWYLFTTLIRCDDDFYLPNKLDDYIEMYRAGKISFVNKDIKDQRKGHQYLPQNCSYAGLVNLTIGRDWFISKSNKHQKIKEEVLHNNYNTTY